MRKPIIALTMGDPAGVGPELVLKALTNPAIAGGCQLTVIGSIDILKRASRVIGLKLPSIPVVSSDEFLNSNVENNRNKDVSYGHKIVDIRFPSIDSFTPSKVTADCGLASFKYIDAAIDAALSKRVDAITTAPINKEALYSAGINFPGHTEILAQRAGAQRWCMMQYSTEVTCTFVTVHVGYHEVPGLITTQRVLDTIELTAEALRLILGREPHLVICGLNPHAGEHGLFGNSEEEEEIEPAVKLAKQAGISIEGPLPPDTAFLPNKRKDSDAVVCMYHDQGHIPLKALAFDSAVNTTLGLPIIRTSVDHGTAYDIAWQGIANDGSLQNALRLASKLSQK